MKIEGSWHDLQTRGLVVVRDFLPPELLERAAREGNADTRPEHHQFGPIGPDVTNEIRARLAELLPPIRQESDLRVTMLEPLTLTFVSPRNVWHTDGPITWIWNDHYNYVNFWLPIVKPDRNKSGVKFVPADALRERAPRFYEAQPGRGAAFAAPAEIAARGEEELIAWHGKEFHGGRVWWPAGTARDTSEPLAICYERDGKLEHIVPEVDLDEISVTPDLAAGDLVVARGDIIHRSEDFQGRRLALSVHGIDGERVLRRDHLTGLSAFNRNQLLHMWFEMLAGQMLGAYAFRGKDTLLAKELVDFMAAVRSKSEPEVNAVKEVMPNLRSILFPS